MRRVLIRPVPTVECPWLDRDLPTGAVVYDWDGHDYGVVSPLGIAVSFVQGEGPFFEIPLSSVQVV